MGAAAAVIGLGLSAISTIDGMKRADAEKARQNAILDNQLLELEDRLTMAKMHNEAVVKGATLMRDRERQIINSQKVQANLAVEEQLLQNQLSQIQARLQAKGITSQAQSAAAQMLGDAANQTADALTQGANELEAAASARTGQASTSGSATSVANQERSLLGIEEAQNRLTENANRSRALAEINQRYAQQVASGSLGLAQTEAGFIMDTAAIQAQSDALYGPYAKRQNELTTRRNQMASKSSKEARIATADMNLLSQQLQTSYGRNAIDAQRPTGGNNLLGAVAQIGSQGLSTAAQLGLFSGGSSGTATTAPVNSWQFGSQRLGVYQGSFDRSFVDTPVGIAGVAKGPAIKAGSAGGNLSLGLR